MPAKRGSRAAARGGCWLRSIKERAEGNGGEKGQDEPGKKDRLVVSD